MVESENEVGRRQWRREMKRDKEEESLEGRREGGRRQATSRVERRHRGHQKS